MKIRNYDLLINKGDSSARKVVLKLINEVLNAVDSEKQIYKMMNLRNNFLTVGNRVWDLNLKKNIYLIGAGKACNAMAQAVSNILSNRLTRGIISIKISEPTDSFVNTEVYIGGHPLPNKEGMIAAQKMIELIEQSTEEDLFITVFSGGSSALLSYPVEGISLEDEIRGQDILLKSGANIVEINAVRRHISRTNGGRLAERIIDKGAEIISLIIGDVVGLPATINPAVPTTFFGTMVGPDRTTITDARSTIINYNLKEIMPESIISFLWDDARVQETPKKFKKNITTFLLGTVADSCEYAVKIARKMGIPCEVYSTFLEGESKEAGFILSTLAREIKLNKRPFKTPCFIVSCGEVTTRLTKPSTGIGGPSHEMALGFAAGIKGLHGISFASIDTEGTDGTTIYAGAIVDTKTLLRLEEKGIDIFDVFRKHYTGNALMELQDNIFTGNTGTNLCDFNVVYVSNEED